LERHFWRR